MVLSKRVDIEINFRERVLKSHYDISTIIVVDTIPTGELK